MTLQPSIRTARVAHAGRVHVARPHAHGLQLADGTVLAEDQVVWLPPFEVGTLIVRGGTVRGDIKATGAVEAYTPAKIYGSITAAEVFIDKGVTFEGTCRMTDREGNPAR